MSSTPGHAHLDNHHRDTLAKIFQHPAGRNIAARATQTTGGRTPSALVARTGSQPHTVHAWWMAERPKSRPAR